MNKKLVFLIIGIMIITALFCACEKAPSLYTISFVSNGGTVVADIEKQAGEPINEPIAPTKTGCEFVGWYAADATEEYVFDTMPANNIVLYAEWNPKVVDITFNRQGGEGGAESCEATYGEPMEQCNAPTKTNYIFDGYYTQINGGGIKYYNADMTSAKISDLSADTVLYAKWIITYLITFESNGGSNVTALRVAAETSFDLPAIPILEGYYFDNWYLDNSTFQNPISSSGIQSDITVYANWIPYFGTPSFNGVELNETGVNEFEFFFNAEDDYDHDLLTFALANPEYSYEISQSPQFIEGEAMVRIFIYDEEETEIGAVEINITAISEE